MTKKLKTTKYWPGDGGGSGVGKDLAYKLYPGF